MLFLFVKKSVILNKVRWSQLNLFINMSLCKMHMRGNEKSM